jgi:uncharacterized protein YbjT (DUF2867 family)
MPKEPNVDPVTPFVARVHRTALDRREDAHAADALAAAGRQGVGHFVYYSVLHPSFRGVPHHLRKLDVESQVKDSTLRWTIIQPSLVGDQAAYRWR